jgi:hypothetical protein
MRGECELQLDGCTAVESGVITAVMAEHGHKQRNVCRSCLEEMVKSGEWEVQGARVSRTADVAVLDQYRFPLVFVDVRKRPDTMSSDGVERWARRIHRNLINHSGVPSRALFLLAVVPGPIYAWQPGSASEPGREPDEVIYVDGDTFPELKSFQRDADQPNLHGEYEKAIADWLRRLQANPPLAQVKQPSASTVSRIADAVSHGTIECEVRLPY